MECKDVEKKDLFLPIFDKCAILNVSKTTEETNLCLGNFPLVCRVNKFPRKKRVCPSTYIPIVLCDPRNSA